MSAPAQQTRTVASTGEPSNTGPSNNGPPTSGRSNSSHSSPPARTLALDDVRRTALVAGGTVLGLLPLRTVFDDTQWLVEAVGAVILVIGPAAVLRLRRGPRAAQLLPGLALVVGYAVVLYLHSSAIHGVLPWRESWHVLGHLRRQANSQVAENVAPMTSTRALRIQIVPGLALLAAVIDYLAVIRRSPALAGIPLLALFTICGASAGTSVGWLPFAGAAAGFLLILSADARINLMRWGRVIPRRSGDGGGVPRLALSGRRIGVLALLLALVVPLGVPGLSRNLLASAFHQQSGGGGSGGGATGTGLSPFAGLRGSLTQSKIVELMNVHVSGPTNPFYLRSKVLDQFTVTGWKASNAKDVTVPLGTEALAGDPPRGPSVRFTAQVRVSGLSDTAVPTFATLQSLRGLSGAWGYSVQQSTVAGGHTARDLSYTETVAQPDPSPAGLRALDAQSALALDSRWSALPASVPAQVRTMTADLVVGENTAYDRARALNDFFTDPTNGFVYNLQTKDGDSGSDLVDFLTNRTGFCQQYAAALAVMLRVSNIPARVVLGYTHDAANKDGNFTVTNHDAHSWVEAYFPQVGWLPFDPTPIDPIRAGRLAYAPRPSVANAPASARETKPRAITQRPRPTTPSAAPAAISRTSGGVHLAVPAWLRRSLLAAAVLALALLLLPLGRGVQRRIRLRSARQSGSAEPLWTELAASARDSGAGWSAALTPRQVPGWLTGLGITASADVTRLARRVESERYAAAVDQPTQAELSDYSHAVATASTQLSHRLDRWRRLVSWLLPASLVRRR